MVEREGRYRIQVVAEMTGVPAPTLRAWERRYGVPIPTRTASAYRLYSDLDVAMVRRLHELCAAGMSIAQAAKEVRATEDAGPIHEPETYDAFEAAQAQIVAAVLAFDPERVEREVSRAIYLGTAVTVFERVLGPVMRQVGELWHAGKISVAQEHIASGVVGNVVRGLARLVQPAAPARRVVLACVEDEEHVLGLHGVAIRLASWGIRSVELGARTPPEAVAEAVSRLTPDAVGLSMTIVPDLARGRSMLQGYAAACTGVPWFVGGIGVGPFAEFAEALGGIVIDGELANVRHRIEQAMMPKPARV